MNRGTRGQAAAHALTTLACWMFLVTCGTDPSAGEPGTATDTAGEDAGTLAEPEVVDDAGSDTKREADATIDNRALSFPLTYDVTISVAPKPEQFGPTQFAKYLEGHSYAGKTRFTLDQQGGKWTISGTDWLTAFSGGWPAGSSTGSSGGYFRYEPGRGSFGSIVVLLVVVEPTKLEGFIVYNSFSAVTLCEITGTRTMCADGVPMNCDDHQPCTIDTCGPNGTCSHTPKADGSPCGGDQTCLAVGTCMAGSCSGKPTCVDDDPCTLEVCDAKTGECSHDPIPFCGSCDADSACDDGSTCTTDTCTSGACTYANKPGCADLVLSDLRVVPAKPTAGLPGQTVTLKWNATNVGDNTLDALANHKVVFSRDGTTDGKADTWLVTKDCTGAFPTIPKPGETVRRTAVCPMPVDGPGGWTVVVEASSQQGDDQPENNRAVHAFTVDWQGKREP